MPAVRLVTCAYPDPDMPHLAAALSARAVDVDVAQWHDQAVDWSDAALTLVRSPWDYVSQLDAFLAWATHVATVSALWNPAGLITWNTHKSYLLELAARGAPMHDGWRVIEVEVTEPFLFLQVGPPAATDRLVDAVMARLA
jgi:hypothetical protein